MNRLRIASGVLLTLSLAGLVRAQTRRFRTASATAGPCRRRRRWKDPRPTSKPITEDRDGPRQEGDRR